MKNATKQSRPVIHKAVDFYYGSGLTTLAFYKTRHLIFHWMNTHDSEQPMMQPNPVCIVMACDTKYFFQLQVCLETLRQWPTPFGSDIKVIAIDLQEEQLEWLRAQSIDVFTDIDRFPRFKNGPRYYAAMAARPYIPETFPGYKAYLWVDSDIRFLSGEGLAYYMQSALDPRVNIVIAQQSEPAYYFVLNPVAASFVARTTYARMIESFGIETANFLRYSPLYNAGIFSARADSPFWSRYKRNLEQILHIDAHLAREQDALNVAIAEVGRVKDAPSIYNWLVEASIPVRLSDGSWVSPLEQSRKVSVAHLVRSEGRCNIPGQSGTMYDFYRKIGLTR